MPASQSWPALEPAVSFGHDSVRVAWRHTYVYGMDGIMR